MTFKNTQGYYTYFYQIGSMRVSLLASGLLLQRLCIALFLRYYHFSSVFECRWLRCPSSLTYNRNYASVLYHFWGIVSYLSKVAYFSLPHLHLVPPFWVTFVQILPRPLASESWSPWAILWCCLRDPMFSHLVEHRLVMDRQTHDDGIYHTSMALHGKN